MLPSQSLGVSGFGGGVGECVPGFKQLGHQQATSDAVTSLVPELVGCTHFVHTVAMPAPNLRNMLVSAAPKTLRKRHSSRCTCSEKAEKNCTLPHTVMLSHHTNACVCAGAPSQLTAVCPGVTSRRRKANTGDHLTACRKHREIRLYIYPSCSMQSTMLVSCTCSETSCDITHS